MTERIQYGACPYFIVLELGDCKMQTCRDNPYKYIMLNLLYPAFLGTIIYQFFEKSLQIIPKLLANEALIFQYLSFLNLYRIIIMISIMFHFIYDYMFLQTKLNDGNGKEINYDWKLFIIDLLVIALFPITLTSIRVVSGVYYIWINLFSLYSAIYLLFNIWIYIVFKNNPGVINSHRITKKRFFVLFILFLSIFVIDIICRSCSQYQNIIFHIINIIFIIILIIACLIFYDASSQKEGNTGVRSPVLNLENR
ncbi:MAG: hypothetical protein AB1546_04855 [bacterium]